MKKKRRVCKAVSLFCVMALSIGFTGCAQESVDSEDNSNGTTAVIKDEATEKAFRDKDSLYENQDPASVKVMYLTVRSGNSEDNTDHTWSDINDYSTYDYDKMGVERYKVEALLQEGDETGIAKDGFGSTANAPNATVQVRGQTSSRQPQKNYKIEIKKEKGTMDGQRTISLNKHVGDSLRFRNKLCYDLISEIPQIMGLRTQFVHLYVKDETASSTSDNFKDYGLYTQVEQLNKTGLKNHGLDSSGHLYKINYFEFYRYEDVIKLQTAADYDNAAFSELLECKGNNDNTKLIEMLDALNNYQIPIEDILSKYFDEENLTYWMAFQMLIGNADTESRNLYIYSPLNSDRWYLIPWDHDASLMYDEFKVKNFTDAENWQTGVSNYWGNVLFNRCLKSEDFRKALDGAVEDVKSHLSKEHITELVEKYRSVAEPYDFALPDRQFEKVTKAQYDKIADNLPNLVDMYYKNYQDSLLKPMPFFIGAPTVEGDKLKINWEAAYDFDSEDMTYHVQLSKDYTYKNNIIDKSNVRTTEISTDKLEPGQYFIRVTATNESGYSQDTFDYYETDKGKVYGAKCFYVNKDGSIVEDINEE